MLYCIYPLETLDFIFKFEQAQRGCFYLMAMAPCLVFLSVQTALNTGLEAQGKLKACLVSQLTSAGVKTLCSLILFAFCRIGIYSVIIGALVGDLFGSVLSCRFIGMGAYEILEIILKPLVLSLVAILCPKILVFGSLDSVPFLVVGIISAFLYILLTVLCNIKEVKRLGKLSKCTK